VCSAQKSCEALYQVFLKAGPGFLTDQDEPSSSRLASNSRRDKLMKTSIARVTLALAVLTSVSAAHAADDMVKRIKERGTLRVCQISYTPYNVKDPRNNEWSGINVDLVKAIASSLKVTVTDVDATFTTVIAALQSDKCDISAGATYINPVRAEQVLFTKSYAADTKTIVTPKGANIDSVESLDKSGTVIAVRAGSTEEVYAKNIFKRATVRATTSDATQPHLMEVATGRADAAFAGFTGAYVFIDQNPNLKLKIVDSVKLDPSPFALMLPLGEYHFQQYANIVIDQMQQSGAMDTIIKHWIPKKDSN
jgi:polar amino acid transport system substrate-binding protein